MFAIELYEPIKHKITQPMAEMRKMVVDTAGQGRLKLTDGFSEKFVSTCLQYDEALSDNYHADTTYSMSIMSYFTLWCGSLHWLERATNATETFVSNFSLTQDFGQLPANMFFTPLGRKNKGKTLIEKYPDATLTSVQANGVTIDSKQAQIRMVINLLAKADFNGDHKQDLLFSIAEYGLQGSHRQYSVMAIGKASKDSAYIPLTNGSAGF